MSFVAACSLKGPRRTETHATAGPPATATETGLGLGRDEQSPRWQRARRCNWFTAAVWKIADTQRVMCRKPPRVMTSTDAHGKRDMAARAAGAASGPP